MNIRRTAMSAFLLAAWCVPPAAGLQGEDVDVEFREEVTAGYEEYLEEREEFFSAQLGDEDTHARMALILVELGLIQVEVDRANDRVEMAQEDIEFQLEELGDLIADELEEEDAEDLEGLLRAIRKRFIEERDEEFEERLEEIFDAIEEDNQETEAALSDLGNAVAERIEEIQEHVDVLLESDAPFAVRFSLEEEVFEVARADLDDIQAIAEALAEGAGEMGDAFDLLAEVGGKEGNAAAIEAMREALRQLDLGLGIWLGALEREPEGEASGVLSLLEPTGDLTEAMRDRVADLDEILAGRVFQVGDMPIRPVALIENRTWRAAEPGEFVPGAMVFSLLAWREFNIADDRDWDADWFETAARGDLAGRLRIRAQHARLLGWMAVVMATGSAGITDRLEDLLLDFYRAGSPEDYTFQGLFPEGLSSALLKIIGADMVVNANASRAELDLHMEGLRETFQARVDADLEDAEANAGLAIVRTYFLIADNHGNVEELIEMAAEGDVAGIVERFDVEDFDYSESLDSTRTNIEVARMEEDMVFLVLEKLDDDPDLFVIDADDDLVLMPLTGGLLGRFLDAVEALGEAATELAELVLDLLEEAEVFFELDLDPNLLDFTEAESPLDFAQALERSNERFLQITPEGREDMKIAGDEIADMLIEFSGAVTEMRELTASLDEEVEVGGMAGFMEEFDEFYQEVQRDFEIPGSTTKIDERVVNLSAWFDNPPDSLLQRFIWMWDDDDATSNTLGGLFPLGFGTAVLEYRTEALPRDFVLDQNYPNPFNSDTVIRFALPTSVHVELALYNLAGQQVTTLVQGVREAGTYAVRWDGRDDNGQELASGVYLYRLRADDGKQVETRKLALVR